MCVGGASLFIQTITGGGGGSQRGQSVQGQPVLQCLSILCAQAAAAPSPTICPLNPVKLKGQVFVFLSAVIPDPSWDSLVFNFSLFRP